MGLDHFEGRSWRGFHHHASLAVWADGFLLLERHRLTVERGQQKAARSTRAKKGAPTSVMDVRATAPQSLLMVDGEGTPLSAFTTDAATSEVQSIEPLVDERLTRRKPKRLP